MTTTKEIINTHATNLRDEHQATEGLIIEAYVKALAEMELGSEDTL